MKYTAIIIVCLLFSYSFAQKPVKIKQIESFDKVYVKYDTTKNYLWLLSIPLEFKVIFNANDSLFVSDAYNYVSEDFTTNTIFEGWTRVPLKIKIGEQYVNQYPGRRYPQQPDTCYYWIAAKYNIKPDSDLQDSLAQYTKQMRNESTTSLNIGTLVEFKKKHPEIVEKIFKNDSIKFLLYKQPFKYIDRIVLPVED